MPAKFVVKQSKKGFSFDLLATNGKVIATSTIYPTRRNCMLGIESVRKNAPSATVIEESGPAKGAAKAAGNGTPGRAAKSAAKSAAKPAAKTAASTGAQAANGTRRGRAAKAAPATSDASAPTKRAGRGSKRTSST